MSGLRRLGGFIDAFRPATGQPPQQLWAFMRWCLSGSWPMLSLAGVFSSIAGATEVVSAIILGWVIDAALNSGPERFFSDHLVLISMFVLFYHTVQMPTYHLTSQRYLSPTPYTRKAALPYPNY